MRSNINSGQRGELFVKLCKYTQIGFDEQELLKENPDLTELYATLKPSIQFVNEGDVNNLQRRECNQHLKRHYRNSAIQDINEIC